MSEPSQQAQIEQLGKNCIDHLTNELHLLESFIEISQHVQNSLGSGDQQTTDELIARQHHVESKIGELGEARSALKETIAATLGIDAASAVIKSVESKFNENQRNELQGLRQRIYSATEKIQELTQTNNVLLQQTIDIYDRFTCAISGANNQSKTYTARGQLRTTLTNPSVIIE